MRAEYDRLKEQKETILRRQSARLEEAVDEIMHDVAAFILEHKIDSEIAGEFVRQTAERAKRRLKIECEP